jgi:calcium-dependent protein kinase
MYVDASCGSPLKLIDFGLSNKFNKGERMEEVCGTLYTLAPEMLSTEGYTEQADIWSVGCLAFILQSNQYPFLQEPHELDDKVKRAALENAHYEFGAGWKQKSVSEKGKDFVRKCLKKDPDERYTGVQALNYVQAVWLPYLDTLEDEKRKQSVPCDADDERNKVLRDSVSLRKTSLVESNVVQGMTTYASYGEFKKRILVTMAFTMDKESVVELRQIFLSLDTNNSGTITYGELKDALTNMHSDKHFEEETVRQPLTRSAGLFAHFKCAPLDRS